MKTTIRKILVEVAKLHPKNKIERRQSYPQLWYCMPKKWVKIKGEYYNNGNQKIRKSKLVLFLQWLCGILTGHEISKTEFGYGGGGYIDRNCRWCDKVIKIPIKENIISKQMEDIMGIVGKEI